MVNPKYNYPQTGCLRKKDQPDDAQEASADTGILVHRDNHHILRGPCPDGAEVRRLLFELEYPNPLREPWTHRSRWMLVTKAFREELRWAVVAGTLDACGQEVRQLLKELAARGVHPSVVDDLEPGGQSAN